jgi:hypothetical protein
MPAAEEPKTTYQLRYDWGFLYEKETNGKMKIERVEVFNKTTSKKFVIDFTQEQFTQIKNKSFSIFCNVYNVTDNSTRRLASEIQPISFVTEHRISIEPQTIFIPTKDNGSYGGNNSKKYSFSFMLKDKNDTVLPYNEETDNDPSGSDITFTRKEDPSDSKYWSYTGEIDVSENSSHYIWEDETQSSRYCEFTFVYCGFTYSAGVTIAKNLAGKSNYNVFIESSSGNILSIGDTKTTLTTNVYYASQKKPETDFTYSWFKDGEPISEKNYSFTVSAQDIGNKATYKCEVYEQEDLIGTASYTLTDITETIPISLILESDLPQNTQIKNGLLYEPNFETGNELEITPSIFIGQEQV